MTVTTTQDAIKAATSIARDVADGKLLPADLEAQAVTELRELVGTVVGGGDPLFELQCDIARQVLSLGGIPAAELAEWTAVMRRRAGDAVEPPGSHDEPLPAVSLASVDESHQESPADDDDAQPEPDTAALQGVSVAGALAALASAAQQAHAEPAPQRRADGGSYDPLRGFNPGATRRH